MKYNFFYFLLITLFLLVSCSKKEINTKNEIQEKNLNTQVKESYEAGMEALESGDIFFAAKKFNEAEMMFPQSKWAPKMSLMAAYAYYSQDYYGDAILELDRFIKLYSNHKDLDYAYYLLAVVYFEQIVDETKDTNSILEAKKYFEIVVQKFPNTDYELDSQFKLGLIDNILASKEMYLGRYYFDRKKWIPSINRFKTVIDHYDTTLYVEEALHRMVEIYFILGLKEEAKKYAQLLGYNYQSSDWYEKSYVLFNKKYENKMKNNNKKDKINKNKFLKRFKSLFN